MTNRVAFLIAILFYTTTIKLQGPPRINNSNHSDTEFSIELVEKNLDDNSYNNSFAKKTTYERICQTLKLIQNMNQEEMRHPEQAEQFIEIEKQLRTTTIQKIDINEQLDQSEIEIIYQIFLLYAQANNEEIEKRYQDELDAGSSSVIDLIVTKTNTENTVSIIQSDNYKKCFIENMLITPLFVLLPLSIQIQIKAQVELEEFANNYTNKTKIKSSSSDKTLKIKKFIQKYDEIYRPIIEQILRRIL